MPTVSLNKKFLCDKLGRQYSVVVTKYCRCRESFWPFTKYCSCRESFSPFIKKYYSLQGQKIYFFKWLYKFKIVADEEFDELCFEFGLELDEVTSEKEIIQREQGADKAKNCSDDVIYKIDVPANRYDLLCMEGLTRGLMIFHEKITTPNYVTTKPDKMLQLHVKSATKQVRPFVVAAVLRNVTLDEDRYASFIDLQDKLHQNICRKRSLVAIGTHDLDTIEAPFVYDAQAPSDIRFCPLGQSKEFTAAELMTLYSTESHLKPYLPIIRDKPVYPVIRDNRGVVLSMPPIINGEHSKIKLTTTNIFIEATATDLNKASVVLDTVVTMFSEYCKEQFSIEPVEVIYDDGQRFTYPALEYREESISADYIKRCVGVELSTEEMAALLTRMSLQAKPDPSLSGHLLVRIPPTRHDVIQRCDVMEDVAIAYGFNRIPERVPDTNRVAYDQPVNKLTDCLRHELAYAGFTECLTFSLCSKEDISSRLGKDIKDIPAVHIANPKNLEFEVVRTTLLPGILRTIQSNRNMPIPLKIFEIQDIVLLDASIDVKSRNERRLCAVFYNKCAGFEVIHGLLDRIMQVLEVPSAVEGGDHPLSYHLKDAQDSTFFPGRCAQVVLNNGLVLGLMGVLHPAVLAKFELNMPCSVLEINIEPFVICRPSSDITSSAQI